MNHTRQMASKNNTPLFWIMCILAVTAVADGYDYRFIVYNLDHNAGTNQTFGMEVYLETGAAYHATTIAFSSSHDTPEGYAVLEGVNFRTTSPVSFVARHGSDASISAGSGSDISTSSLMVWRSATAQKILRARFSPSSGSLSGGVIRMERRVNSI